MVSFDSHVAMVDVDIQFIEATGLPKMDVVGLTDPYFVATLDGRITHVSRVIKDTCAPVWNEGWRVRNVPSTTMLTVSVLDKDQGSQDDIIGTFSTDILPGTKELEISGSVFFMKKARGTFTLSVASVPSKMPERQRPEFQFIFDGPVRFTRHFSPAVGKLTASSTVRTVTTTTSKATEALQHPAMYSTSSFHLKSVPLFFGETHQPWNQKYAAAQKIFGAGPGSAIVRTAIQGGHKLLYSKGADNGVGILEETDVDSNEPVSLKSILHASGDGERIKPAVYTYIISSDDNTFRFSETGAAFLLDFASKHALHSNCAPTVRYSGEFHPRPVGGWAQFNDELLDDDVEWELVVDNNSGTYAPDKAVLPVVKWCLEYNFGCILMSVDPSKRGKGFRVVVHDRGDPELTQSVEACREYASRVRGVAAPSS